MQSKKRYQKRLTVYVTQELLSKLTQLRDQRSPQDTIPDVVRDALRAYVDEQEQIIGSRRHFQKTLRDDISNLKKDLKVLAESLQIESMMNQVFSIILTANGIAAVLTHITGQQISCETVLRAAAAPGISHNGQVMKLLDHVQEKVLTEPRGKSK